MLRGTVIAGRLPVVPRATFLGGCLSLATGMLSAGFRPRLDPRGKWIVLEDISEAIHRIDRQFAHFKIAGWFDACAGVLIGDFHDDVSDQFAAVRELLAFHVPRNLPVIHAPEVGHGWPQAMLPIGKPVTLRAAQSTRGAQKVELAAPWEQWRVIGKS
jgi:muramoyltetrapeptide carboxypeptidase